MYGFAVALFVVFSRVSNRVDLKNRYEEKIIESSKELYNFSYIQNKKNALQF